MRVRLIDQNGDYVCTGRTADFLTDSSAAVAQCIQTALQLWQGQFVWNTDAGVPWQSEVLGRYPQPLYDSVIKEAITNVSGVSSIASYSSTYNAATRALTVNVIVQTIFGSSQLSITL